MPRRRLSEASAARSRVERQGFEFPAKPGDEIPTLPDDLTELDDQQLMELFSEFTAWTNFASVRASMAEVDEAEKLAAHNMAEAAATVENWWPEDAKAADKVVTITKAKRDLDDDVIEAAEELRRAHAYRKLMATLVQNLERSTALLSRELTRRVGTSPVDRRQARWGGG